MARLGKHLLAWGTFGAVMVSGWALMTYTVPSKEEMMKVDLYCIEVCRFMENSK